MFSPMKKRGMMAIFPCFNFSFDSLLLQNLSTNKKYYVTKCIQYGPHKELFHIFQIDYLPWVRQTFSKLKYQDNFYSFSDIVQRGKASLINPKRKAGLAGIRAT